MDYCVRWLTAVLRLVANCNASGNRSSNGEEVYQAVRQGRGWRNPAQQVVELRYTILRLP
jgi:hypothetical protein